WEGADKLTNEHLLELAGEEEGTAVEQESLDDFFHAVPPEDAEKFQKLAKVLQEQLSGVKVYKVGDEAEKAAYVVGKTKDGQWAGLKTTVVET
ncbi:MAG TPA: nuclease A inhibitor family protein, partial [Gemmataceae bacterium]|nr:nuclease A inhibitor family protein [Gemmataceae bacterium]